MENKKDNWFWNDQK